MIDFRLVDSTMVLFGQTAGYTLYSISIILVMGWIGWRLTQPGPARGIRDGVFYAFVAGLAVLGFSLHFITSQTIPWVEWDINPAAHPPDKTVRITMEDHRFLLPASPVTIACGETVLFDVTTNDLTYGFGLFREDNSMVLQMQVVPGHKNQLVWRFQHPGAYTIRSTEYSGPAGHAMIVRDAVVVTACPASGTQGG